MEKNPNPKFGNLESESEAYFSKPQHGQEKNTVFFELQG